MVLFTKKIYILMILFNLFYPTVVPGNALLRIRILPNPTYFTGPILTNVTFFGYATPYSYLPVRITLFGHVEKVFS